MPVWFGLAVGLVAYNTALNLLPTPRWLYVPANVLLAALLLAVGRGVGRSWRELGFGDGTVRNGLVWGGAVAIGAGLLIAAAVLLTDRLPLVAAALGDRRVAGLGGTALVLHALVRIPLGTALLEEAAFRGVLLAQVRAGGSLVAAVAVSSVAFGLWHIGPSLVTVHVNAPGASLAAEVVAVAVAVAVTTVAGVGLAALRLLSGSLLAPILGHAAVNISALLAAARG